MGVKLAEKNARAFNLDMSLVLYITDSMAVLYWLTWPWPLLPYAGHWTAQILQERSSHKQWSYVHSSQNPSDLPTPIIRARVMASTEVWWKGPSFLRQLEEDWPEKPYIKATENAAAETRTLEEISKQIVLPARGQEHPNYLHLLLKMKPLLRSIWRMLRAL